ncbi:unnamed protein product, partial [Brenthis ino]
MIEVEEKDDKPIEDRQHLPSVGELSDHSREDSFISLENDKDETYIPEEESTSEEELQSNTIVRTLPQRQRREPDRY